MSTQQRIRSVIIGVLTLLLALILIIIPEVGSSVVAFILSVSLIFYGIRTLYYYFSMARYMVSGRLSLYIGVVVLDFGMLLWTITDIPKLYIALYLLATHVFSGAIDILRGTEAKKFASPKWKKKILSGVIHIIFGILCIVFVRSTEVIIWIYCIGLIYSGCVRIASAFRRTAIVYIQ